MGYPVVITKSLAAASANNIATSQTGSAGTGLIINGSTSSSTTGGIATLDTQRRVLVTSSGNDTGCVFTIVGTNEGGNTIGETVTGASGTGAASLQDYLTIISVTPSTATASGVQVGTNATGSSSWKIFDDHIGTPNISLAGQVTVGAGTYSAEYTYDAPQGVSPNLPNLPWTYATIPNPIVASGLSGITGTVDVKLTNVMRAWRLTISTGTGTIKLTGIQAGIV